MAAIKYATVRTDPREDVYLRALLDVVDRQIIVSGIGERPAIVHLRDFGLQGFTSGSVCVAPNSSMRILSLCKEGAGPRPRRSAQQFLPLENLRDAFSPIRVLHDAVTLAGIADMGPMLPMLSNLPDAQRTLRARGGARAAPARRAARAVVSVRRKSPEQLRSHRWYGVNDLRSFGHRSRTAQMGYTAEDYRGKPVIAIVNTWSDINPCHSHFKQRVEEVKRGIWQAGGFPVEIPAMTLSEPFQKPTTMLYRNLLAMETEEILRSYPADGCVLMGGCDKTAPALLMGAISMDLPTIFVPAGPMLRGDWNGVVLGSGSDTWKYWAELRCGNITQEEWTGIENGIARSPGHCMTMGTASTMTSAAEVLGFILPGFSSTPGARLPPRADGRALRPAHRRDGVGGPQAERPPHRRVVRQRRDDGARAERLEQLPSCTSSRWRAAPASRSTSRASTRSRGASRCSPTSGPPASTSWRTSSTPAGSVPCSRSSATSSTARRATRTGRRSPRTSPARRCSTTTSSAARANPLVQRDGLVVLTGNLAPRGAVMKPPAAEPALLAHTGRAVVFASYDDMAARIDDPALDVDASSVLVLQNAGPIGAPGMPEWGQLPIPKKLLAQGVRDMVRISDARMSGTSYGACVLHVDAGVVRRRAARASCATETSIRLDVAARTLSISS